MQTLIRERKRISKPNCDIVILEFWNYQFGYRYKIFQEVNSSRQAISNYLFLWQVNDYLAANQETLLQAWN